MAGQHDKYRQLVEMLDEDPFVIMLALALRGDAYTNEELAKALAAFDLGFRSRKVSPKQADAFLEALHRYGVVERYRVRRFVRYFVPVRPAFAVLELAHERGLLVPALVAEEASIARPTWARRLARARARLVMGDATYAADALAENWEQGRSGAEKLCEGSDYPVAFDVLGVRPSRNAVAALSLPVLRSYAQALGTAAVDQGFALDPRLVDELAHALDAALGWAKQRGGRVSAAGRRLSPDLSRSIALTTGRRSQLLWAQLAPADKTGVEIIEAVVARDLPRAFELGRAFLTKRAASWRGFGDIEGLFFAIAALDAAHRGEPDARTVYSSYLERERRNRDTRVTEAIQALLRANLLGEPEVKGVRFTLMHAPFSADCWPNQLTACLLSHWLEVELPSPVINAVAYVHDRLNAFAPDTWLMREFDAYSGLVEGEGIDAETSTLVGAYRSRPAWERLLDRIEHVVDQRVTGGAAGAEPGVFQPHLVWELGPDGSGGFDLSARWITSPRSAKGRDIPIETLFDDTGQVLDERDAQVIYRAGCRLDAMSPQNFLGRWRGRAVFVEAIVPELVGHPRVRNAERAPVKVVRRQPRLVANGDDAGVELGIEPQELLSEPVHVTFEDPQTVAVYELEDDVRDLAVALATSPGRKIPTQGMARLRPALARLSAHIEVEGRGNVDLVGKTVEPSSELELELWWRPPVLSATPVVCPLGEQGPRVSPGEGPESVTGDVSGSLLSTTRALAAEKAALEALLEACPAFAALEPVEAGTREVSGLEDAYTLIS